MTGTAGPNCAKRTPGVALVHACVKGRLRLQVPGLYRNHALGERLEKHLNGKPGIRRAQASTRTGNLLIIHSDTLSAEKVRTLVMSQVIQPGADRQVRRSVHRPPSSISREAVTRLFALARAFPGEPHTAGTDHRQPAQRGLPVSWHQLSRERMIEALDIGRPDGLGSREARARLARYGPNRLSTTAPRTDLAIVLEQFSTLPVALLGASAVVSIATGGLLDAGVILGVVMINAAIGYVTERQAEDTIRALDRVEIDAVNTLRDGRLQRIALESVVPGDLLVLSPGSYIAADVRLLTSHRLSIDESALTGESLPAQKDAGFRAGADTPLAERRNMAYMGTHVTGGSGRGLVVATAAYTELGHIQSLVGEAASPDTPMQKQLGELGSRLAILSGLVCVGVFGLGLLRGQNTLSMLKAAVSLAVAAVPEGLPAVATTTLALGIRDMRKRHVAVRHLDAVETLGSTQVLCLDKTGTLTENRMVVEAVHCGGQTLRIEDGCFAGVDDRCEDTARDDLLWLLKTAVLCNESTLENVDQHLQFDGSPTEQALVKAALKAGIDVTGLRRDFPRLHTRYRAEQRPYMSTLHRQPAGAHLLAVKGRPAEVLQLCDRYRDGNAIYPLDDAVRKQIAVANEQMAGDALRVLGFAAREQDDDDMPAHAGALIWLGLIGMVDPIRPGMPELVRAFHDAGIRTVMITGDQSATAYAVGRRLGLSDGKPLQVLEASRLDTMDAELVSGLAENVHVFSRVSPAHKLTIVRALQRRGLVVAMTGDGINDSPALKAADIGVAMGRSGTDIAHSVSDVVLEDDNLHTLAVATQHGRSIYGNIRKTIHFLVSTNLTEIEIMLVGIALGYGAPLNPMQLLWINLVSDIFPGLALSMEPPEAGIMRHPPRDPHEAVIPRRDLFRMVLESTTITTGALAAYGYGLHRYGAGSRAGTLAFTTLTVGELLHALSCRSRYRRTPGSTPANPHLTRALAGTLTAQALVTAVPSLRRLLGLTGIGLTDALVICGGIAAPLLINALSKPPAPYQQEPRP